MCGSYVSGACTRAGAGAVISVLVREPKHGLMLDLVHAGAVLIVVVVLMQWGYFDLSNGCGDFQGVQFLVVVLLEVVFWKVFVRLLRVGQVSVVVKVVIFAMFCNLLGSCS